MCFSSQQTVLRRRGFTLVELLVVIAIIAILAAMAAYAVFAMVGGTQSNNTKSTIKVVYKILQTHWKAVIEEADKDDLSQFPAIVAMAGGDTARARVLLRKARLTEAFPQSYAEIGNHTLIPPQLAVPASQVATPPVYQLQLIPPGQQRYIADYQQKMLPYWTQVVNNTLPTTVNPLSQSGACLRLALSIARGGGAVALSDDSIKYAIFDTDGDGIPELIDSFENPKQALAFFRFAWNYQNPASMVWMNPPSAPATAIPTTWTVLNPGFNNFVGNTKKNRNAAFCDPLDTDGTLVNSNWVFNSGTTVPNPNRLQFEMFFHPVTNPYPLTAATKAPFTACYVMPVIVSAGPGLDPRTNTRPFGFNMSPAYSDVTPVNGTGSFVSAFPDPPMPAFPGLVMPPADMSIDPHFLNPPSPGWIDLRPLLADNIYSFQLTGN